MRSRILLLTALVLIPSATWAQTSGIAGVVRDTTGGVMPGVTVEAASPALIEKVRTAVTDNEGQYKIINLQSGTYTVTFTLPGFSAVERQGVVLTSNFTATVNAELRVGAVSETVTVSGQSPLVDTQSVTQQKSLSAAVIDALPTGRSFRNLSVLVPGVQLSSLAQQDVGGSGGDHFQTMSVHGSRADQMPLVINGMPYNNMNNTGGGYNTTLTINTGTVQEVTVTTSGLSAESRSSGVLTNTIPKDGGNTFTAYLLGNFTNSSLQSNNLSQDLLNKGLKSTATVVKVWDVNPAMGGPIVKDKLWFYGGFRHFGAQTTVADAFANKNPGAPQYCANPAGCLYNGVLVADSRDLTQPAIVGDMWNRAETVNLAWQASQKNKVTAFLHVNQRLMQGSNVTRQISPESGNYYTHNPEYLFQSTWSNPYTNKLLFEAGVTFYNETWISGPPGGPQFVNGYGPNAVIMKTETSLNTVYGSNSWTVANNHQYNIRFATNYVTGSHAFKVGMADMWGTRDYRFDMNQAQSWTLTNGVPKQITEYARPQIDLEHLKAALALYAQDRWTIQRLTMNLGLRFDYQNAYVPAQSYPAIPFVAARSLDAIDGVPIWKDVSPRLGATFDVFGNGKTVARVNYGKYLASESTNMATLNNPVNTSINTAVRTWTDTNGNFVPDCDLSNRAANGECGQLNQPLGALSIVAHYDPAITQGWGVRPNDQEVSVGLQQELRQGLAVDVQFTRHSFGNFFATQNTALPSALAYKSYCVTAPSDPQLPGGGGNQICGFMDVNPAPYFGAAPNYFVTKASNFGDVSDVYTGLDVNVTARLKRGGVLSGGVSAGHEVTDICAVAGQANVGYAPVSGVSASTAGAIAGFVATPSTLFCHIAPPFQPDMKMLLSYPLPWWGLTASATIQSRPGPQITADYVVSSSNPTVQATLGRNLSLGTATVQLIAPGTLFGDRVNQVDLRFGKNFQVGKSRIKASFDLYNALNSGAILSVATRYSTTNNAWQLPTNILQGRLIKFGAQLDF